MVNPRIAAAVVIPLVVTATVLGVVYTNPAGHVMPDKFQVRNHDNNGASFTYTHGNGRVVESDIVNTGTGLNFEDKTHNAAYSIKVGNKKFDFTVDQTTQSYSLQAHGHVLDADDIAALTEHSASVSEHGRSKPRGKALWNSYAINKMSEWLQLMPVGYRMTDRAENYTVTHWDPPAKAQNVEWKLNSLPNNFLSEYEAQTVTCSPALHYQNDNDYQCPRYGSLAQFNLGYPTWAIDHPNGCGAGSACLEKNDGTTCMSPAWSGTSTYGAVYDTLGDGLANTEWWGRHHAGDASQCSGRCGAGCNWLDQESMWDCFDHDACVDSQYSDGSATGTSSYYCGDELDAAFGDYVVTLGSYC